MCRCLLLNCFLRFLCQWVKCKQNGSKTVFIVKMNETDINILCRLCLNKSYFYSNIYIDQSTGNNPFYEDINYVYDLHIAVEDGLPEYICQKCLCTVKEFKLHKSNAHIAKMQLEHIKQKMNYETDVEDERDGKYLKTEGHNDQIKNSTSKMYIKQEPDEFDESSFEDEMPTEENEVIAEAQVFIKEEDEEISAEGLDEEDFSNADRRPALKPEESNIHCHLQEFSNSVSEDNEIQKNNPKLFNLQMIGQTLGKQRKVTNSMGHNMMELEEKKFRCEYCGKGFNHKNDFKKHIMTHTDERPNRCLQCGKGFISRYELNRHQIVHTKERPHQCQVCGKTFQRKYDLKKHGKGHEEGRTAMADLKGGKKFVCDYCGKGFNHKNDFKKHIMTHTNERPNRCLQCGKGFISRYELNRHQVVHTGERPFQCDLCTKTFQRKSEYKKHYATHT